MQSIDPLLAVQFNSIVSKQEQIRGDDALVRSKRDDVAKLTAHMARLEKDKALVEAYQHEEKLVRPCNWHARAANARRRGRCIAHAAPTVHGAAAHGEGGGSP